MDYLISFITEQSRGDMSEKYTFARFYAPDKENIPAIFDELCSAALNYAKMRGGIPDRVAVFRYDDMREEDGETLLYNIYSLYRDAFVYAKLIRVSDEQENELDPLPQSGGQFGPVFHGDWNVIYRDIHYREDFTAVYENFLKGIDPPVRPDAKLPHA